MDQSVITIRDTILANLLPDIAFEGWTWTAVESASVRAGYDSAMALAVFPRLDSVLDHFSDWADRAMLERLSAIDSSSLKIRERVRTAAATRLELLTPWKEAVRLAGRYWSVPYRARHGAKLIWRTADKIWIWAGDTATDYNRFTKRGLLSGVLSSTTLVWLADRGEGLDRTFAFLDRRIENVMQFGRILGKMKRPAMKKPVVPARR